MRVKSEKSAILVKDKEELKEQVKARIQLGLNFTSRVITTEGQKQELWDEFIDWDVYNLELIKQAFDNSDNSYAEEYKRQTGFNFPIGGDYEKPTFQESVNTNKDSMNYQLRKLKWFYDKIDLFKCNSGNTTTDDFNIKFIQLTNLLSRFHKIAQELRDRRQNRETLIIRDEYDVQDLLKALLHIHFDDIRKEDFSPSLAGANSRLDFVLKNEKIILEIKMSNERLGAKELGEELLIDIGRYKEYPDCKQLVIFIYDKGDFVRNKKGLIRDLEKQSTNDWKVTVVVNPE